MKKSVFFILSTLLLAFVLFVQCDKDDPASPEPVKTPSEDYMVYDNGSGTIGKAGGEVKITSSSSLINGAKVIIPEGALDKNTTITIKEGTISKIQLPEEVGKIIELEPSGTTFKSPIKVVLPYNKKVDDASEFGVYY